MATKRRRKAASPTVLRNLRATVRDLKDDTTITLEGFRERLKLLEARMNNRETAHNILMQAMSDDRLQRMRMEKPAVAIAIAPSPVDTEHQQWLGEEEERRDRAWAPGMDP